MYKHRCIKCNKEQIGLYAIPCQCGCREFSVEKIEEKKSKKKEE